MSICSKKAFTDEEKKNIVGHKGYKDIRKDGHVYLYLPKVEQLNKVIENVYDEPVEETNLAKEMSKHTGYYDADGHYISPTGKDVKWFATYKFRGIRPMMDLYLDNIKEK